ncbi:MAG: D-aminoacyl-tRNA deacylase [Coriobacteriia bacterium]|nr:D-aminoacyl-tRNA deacylase [Coriobacteriia bacterium]
MRALIQRVNHASVTIEGEDARVAGGDGAPITHSIGRGYLVLLGVGQNDDEATAEKLWTKASKLRLFEDETGKTNLSLSDVGGELLLVSQFTLYADCKKGNRPSFTKAGAPQRALELYEHFAELARRDGAKVETGWFGAMMRVNLENDGPFTIWLDSDVL